VRLAGARCQEKPRTERMARVEHPRTANAKCHSRPLSPRLRLRRLRIEQDSRGAYPLADERHFIRCTVEISVSFSRSGSPKARMRRPDGSFTG